MNKDSNRFKVDALLAVARLTSSAGLRERILEEILELLDESDLYIETKRGGRPSCVREEVMQHAFEIVSRGEVSSKQLKGSLEDMGYSKATVRRAVQDLVQQGIFKAEHRGGGPQHECYYSLGEQS